MSEAKRIGTKAFVSKPSTVNRNLLSAASPSLTVAKNIIIKSVDIKDDMEMEAVDVAMAVSLLYLPLSL
ncbi:hypothetical protein U1Q18_028501 [Sarracenia purpurea var. burkii]